MSNQLGVTVNGVHKVGQKAFLTINGIHREVKMAFLTVNSVYKECYTSCSLDEDLILSLIDFEYTDNGDGTATLTAWKGTLNGVPSTKIIIPDSDRIIL